MTTARLWICAALLLQAALAHAAKPAARVASTVQGTVTQVSTGDSLVLTPPGAAPLAVRLRDIDAPEPCQPGAEEARRALAELALNKSATLSISGRDRLGHTVGTVTIDTVNVGTRMVEEGHAWSIRIRYDQGPLVKQERMAHALGRGVHGVAGAVMPRDFRRSHGPCSMADGTVLPTPALTPALTPAPVPARSPAFAAPLAAVPAVASAYRCDGRTRCTQMTSCAEARFFLANCPNVQMDGNHDGVPCERQWCK